MTRWLIVGVILLGFASPSWATHQAHIFTLDVDCQESELCTLDIVKRLEAKYGCKFHADAATDTVCGAVQIIHGTPHTVTIYLYDTEELPTTTRKSHLKPMPSLPDRVALQTEIQNIPKSWTRTVGLKTKAQEAEEKRLAAEQAIKTKLGLTDAEFQQLQESLR